jgi:hypothetical protein
VVEDAAVPSIGGVPVCGGLLENRWCGVCVWGGGRGEEREWILGVGQFRLRSFSKSDNFIKSRIVIIETPPSHPYTRSSRQNVLRR